MNDYTGHMKKVTSVTNLKAKLSAHLSQVKLGEEFLVTDRGKPVARLIPVREQALENDTLDLILRGAAHAPQKNDSLLEFLEIHRPARCDHSVLQALLEERADDR